MKKIKIGYWISTGLLTAMMLMSASMYFLNHSEISILITSMGFPSYIIYPLAIAKLLGLVAIWTKKYKLLMEWAYAGFFFNFVLALFAHLMINDGEFVGAAIALVLLSVSYFTGKKLAV